jgi:hypothetical protein
MWLGPPHNHNTIIDFPGARVPPAAATLSNRNKFGKVRAPAPAKPIRSQARRGSVPMQCSDGVLLFINAPAFVTG